MKKEINNVLILMTLGGLVFNGCASRSIVVVDDNFNEIQKRVEERPKPFSWSNIKASKPIIKTKVKKVLKEEAVVEKAVLEKSIVENGFKAKLNSDFQNPVMGSIAFGKASLYGEKLEGQRTASGDIFNINQKTASHGSLPFNTMLKVTNLQNSLSETVRVNDRGRFSNGTILNISPAAAKSLQIESTVPSNVKVEILGFDGIIVNKAQASNSGKTEDCKDCYVTVPIKNSRIVSVVKQLKPISNYEYKVEPVQEVAVKSTYDYEENPSENRYSKVELIDESPLIENFSEKTAIQVGAFREYAGAKLYAKKYDLLSNKYSVDIKENDNLSEPLYRVSIAGFNDDAEAREFISKYELDGAFLVIK